MQVSGDANLGHVCGTAGKVFYLEMDIKVRRFHDRGVVPGYLRESLSLRCVSVDGSFDRKEPNGTAGLSWLCCSVGYLCCCLYISVSSLRRGARMTSCFWM